MGARPGSVDFVNHLVKIESTCLRAVSAIRKRNANPFYVMRCSCKKQKAQTRASVFFFFHCSLSPSIVTSKISNDVNHYHHHLLNISIQDRSRVLNSQNIKPLPLACFGEHFSISNAISRVSKPSLSSIPPKKICRGEELKGGEFISSSVSIFLVCVSLSVIVEVRMVRRNFFSFSRLTEMGCCSCFGFLSKSRRQLRTVCGASSQYSQEFLLPDDVDVDGDLYNGDSFFMPYESNGELQRHKKGSEEILLHRIQSGMICREIPVKETRHVIRTEDENGNKMVNEYVREWKIGSGSYAKVVLYRSTVDGKRYAIKAFHKSHLLRLRVAPSETAMTDVLREVLIMKMLDHPNIVNLIEVIDDPNTDHFYMVLEYVEGKWVCEGSGPPGGLREDIARRFLRDIVSGLMYLHSHNIVHGDIKPDNLLVTSSGAVKIGDFSVSQVFEDDNDELRRSPGTPVFTAPECCLGLTYGGRAADTWALGVTLFCMVLGEYPFLGDTLQDTYDKIVNDPLPIPKDINPHLKHLLEALLCKDPKQRIVLEDVAVHPWVVADEGPIPQFLCRCKRMNLKSVESADDKTSADVTH